MGPRFTHESRKAYYLENYQSEILALVLSASQKVLIKTTWRIVEADMQNIGTLVFLRVFDQKPSVKELFPFKDCWGDELLEHPMFKDHAHRSVVNSCGMKLPEH